MAAVPRTLTGKKLEVPVKRIIQGARAADVTAEGAVTHPEVLAGFEEFATRLPSGHRRGRQDGK
ncbi:hypothetical protein ACIO6T_21810 [Streptomyces sp. NPDC087532]|uniref:hypothetical protein n=1 Tax=unclassified Streptomyces TaxID=2593676 RepID=UPI00331E58FE